MEAVAEAGERIPSLVADTDNDEVAKQVRAVVWELAGWGVRTHCSEPNRGRPRWTEPEREQQAVYAEAKRGEAGLPSTGKLPTNAANAASVD